MAPSAIHNTQQPGEGTQVTFAKQQEEQYFANTPNNVSTFLNCLQKTAVAGERDVQLYDVTRLTWTESSTKTEHKRLSI